MIDLLYQRNLHIPRVYYIIKVYRWDNLLRLQDDNFKSIIKITKRKNTQYGKENTNFKTRYYIEKLLE